VGEAHLEDPGFTDQGGGKVPVPPKGKVKKREGWKPGQGKMGAVKR